MFMLVEPGTEIHRPADPGIIALTTDYMLTYAEGNGELPVQPPDGGAAGTLTVPKGFSLVRQDAIRCAAGYDQSCIDRKVAMGFPEARVKNDCAIDPQFVAHPVGVPTDTELTLTVRDPNAPPPDYTIPCP
jgi:hypothetical protein